MNFFKEYTLFQKIFVIFFVITGILSFLQPVLMGQGTLASIFSLIGIIGLISTISGVFTCIYQVRATLAFYFWWILNTITLAIVSLDSALYGQFIENIIFMVPLEIIGFIAWKRNIKANESGEISVRKLSAKMWIISIIVLIIGWAVYAYFLVELPTIFKVLFNMNIAPDQSYITDSLTAATTIYAVYLTSARYLEQWYFWFLANLVGTILFIQSMVQAGSISANDLAGALVWIQFGVISIYGYYWWRKMYNKKA